MYDRINNAVNAWLDYRKRLASLMPSWPASVPIANIERTKAEQADSSQINDECRKRFSPGLLMVMKGLYEAWGYEHVHQALMQVAYDEERAPANDLAERASRTISSGGQDTEDTLAIVAELDAVGQRKPPQRGGCDAAEAQ